MPARMYKGVECEADGCSLQARSKGCCLKHYQRKAKYGDPNITVGPANGSEAVHWKGGRYLNGNGYVHVTLPVGHPMRRPGKHGGAILEHRLVMMEHLGRPLRKDESVHHINGDRSDNRIENLQLRQGKHGNGVVRQCADCGSHNIVEVGLADVLDL